MPNPLAVATPLPPTKPSQIGNPWPAMTATPPSMSCQVGRSRNATATAPPFAASSRQTATPQP